MNATRRRLLLLVSALLVAFVAVGCRSRGPAPEPTLAEIAGKEWTLASWTGGPVASSAGLAMTVRFDMPGRVGGQGPVNRYFGIFAQGPGRSLTWGEMGATRRAGPEADMALEQRFLEDLARTTTYSFTRRELTLSGPNGQPTMTFRSPR